MTILVTGADGYIGWPALMRLALRHPDETIVGVDNGFRRIWVHELGAWSAVPINSIDERIEAFKEMFNQNPLVLKERRPRRKRWVETYFVYVPRKPWTYETAVLLHKLRDDEVVRIWRGICEQ